MDAEPQGKRFLMLALRFFFVHGRYHATPWGRHVNEGAVAWPPEPWRLLRALIACWHRKGDPQRQSEATLHELIEALAETAPSYRLPKAVHAHTRHFMPQACLDKGKTEAKALVLDAFFRVATDDPLVVIWPDVALSPAMLTLAQSLTEQLHYLGRAESTVVGEAIDTWRDDSPLSCPLTAYGDRGPPPGWGLADVIAALPAGAYMAARPHLKGLGAKSKPAARRAIEACLPGTLTEAMQIGTGQLQAAGWSQPPASRTMTYAVPPVGPILAATRRMSRPRGRVGPPTVARLLLAGRPRPRMTEAVVIAEVFRAALMHAYTRLHGGEPAPPLLSGRDKTGARLKVAGHAHAFFLPEDSDGDGHIDHLVLYASAGLDPGILRAVNSLRRLWHGANGRREWQVAVDGVGQVAEFAHSGLLRPSATWTSATPYLRPRHTKPRDGADAVGNIVRWECTQRRWDLPEIALVGRHGREVLVGAVPTNTLRFQRFRTRKALVQPDRTGTALHLTFTKPRTGPVALGFASHFGLGLFAGQP